MGLTICGMVINTIPELRIIENAEVLSVSWLQSGQ
jgi:hypothetical protein